ncbi:hypothetical protein JXB02_04500 [Candidatus Woesearchaeota archaeon]|nr:hypothetical protein [Candidatus Woesearchaeota archaeon]
MPKSPTTIETGVDRLLDLLICHKELALTEAAARLNVPKRILDHWCDMLEEEGVIALKHTLKETFIVNKEHHEKNGSKRSSVIQNLRSIALSTKSYEEKAIEKKTKELERQRHLHDESVKRLKAYERMKREVERRNEEFLKEHEMLIASMKEIGAEKRRLEDLRAALVESDARIGDRERILEHRVATFRKDVERIVARRTRRLDARESEIASAESSLAKRAEEISRREQELVERETDVLDREQVIGSIIRIIRDQKDLLMREKGIIRRHSEMLEGMDVRRERASRAAVPE